MKIGVTWNPKNKFCVARVHYSVDPEKSTPDWIAKAKEGMSERGWNREYEISYDIFEGKPVYPLFTEQRHVTNLVYTPPGILYGGWDFGYHRPAFVVAQINAEDQFCIMGEVLGEDEGIKAFGSRVLQWRRAKFPGAEWIDACDPAGDQRTDKAEFTSIQALNEIGIYPISRKSNIREGIEIIDQRMRMRTDGRVGFLIDPSCRVLIDGFKGGYRYPVVREGMTEAENPQKDGYYDHLQDAMRYIAINVLDAAVAQVNRSSMLSNNELMRSTSSLEEYF